MKNHLGKSKRRYFWLTGDRFACVERKNVIVEKLKQLSDFHVEYLEGDIDIDYFQKIIKTENLFGPKNIIYILDGKLPHTKKTISIISNIPSDKRVIHIEEKSPIKNTSFYKEFKDYLEEYATAGRKNFLPRQKKLDIKNVTKKICKWEGPEDLFDKIFESAGYDYGCTVNEINKIRLYTGEEYPSIEDIQEALYVEKDHDFMKLVDLIKRQKREEALFLLENLNKGKHIQNNFMVILASLFETYTFLFYGCVAKENGHNTQDGICQYIIDHWRPGGERKDPHKTNNRLFYDLNIIKKNHSSDFARRIKEVRNAMNDCLESKYTHKYIFSKLICKV